MNQLFPKSRSLFIGVIHLKPLPGSPRWRDDMASVVEAAVRDARAYQNGGAVALCIENFGDVPFTKGRVPPETIAAMTAAGCAVRKQTTLPIGFNVLRNDPCAALALCAACGGSFIRTNVHTGVVITDQGIIEGNAYETLRYRKRICPDALIFADVHVKHGVPLGNDSIENAARDTLDRGLADALILSGPATGSPAEISDVERVRAACPSAKILLGSGVLRETICDYLELIDGFFVASSVKFGGQISRPVDQKRVSALAAALP